MYLKHINTGKVKTLEEWTKSAINEFTELYNNDDTLKEEFPTLDDFINNAERKGEFHTDLVECNSEGERIEYE